MKYIDSDKLIAKIEGRIGLNQMMLEKDSRPSDYGRIEEGRYILRFVERIQQEQPEVDLEKELEKWRHDHFKGKRNGDYNGEYLERESQLDLAHHFYELGLKARK